jgi:ferredoxin
MRLTILAALLTLGVSTVLAIPTPNDDYHKKKYDCEKDGKCSSCTAPVL